MSLSALEQIELLRAKKRKFDNEINGQIKELEQTLPTVGDLVIRRSRGFKSVHILLAMVGDVDDPAARCVLGSSRNSGDADFTARLSTISVSKRNAQFKEMKDKEHRVKYEIQYKNNDLKVLQEVIEDVIEGESAHIYNL